MGKLFISSVLFVVFGLPTFLTFWHVFNLKKIKKGNEDCQTIFGKILYFMQHSLLFLVLYVCPVFFLSFFHLCPKEKLASDIELVGPACFMFIAGLFCLRHFLGFILNREGSIGADRYA
ncbi:hypothetical protein KAS41_03240 [Candidatus Parcubacteria bacterium]|nr:hypothetical protein [Candidatus Parcubacteria bacterium]